MNIVGYIRVSTGHQKISIEAQEQAIREYANKKGISEISIFIDEAVSGSTGISRRKGILDALSVLNKKSLLVVQKRDRLSRDNLQMALIESSVSKKGARIISIAGEGTESDDGGSIFIRRIMDAFGEYERYVISARCKTACNIKRERGEIFGMIPFGYRAASDGIKIEKDEEEYSVLALMIDLRLKKLSFQKIADHLNDKGFVNRNGSPWHKENTCRIINANIGK